jgi:hypothetical protein
MKKKQMVLGLVQVSRVFEHVYNSINIGEYRAAWRDAAAQCVIDIA